MLAICLLSIPFSYGGSFKLDKVSIPVGWTTTKAFFKSKQVSTQTESYRGVWDLSILENGKAYIRFLDRKVEVVLQGESSYGLPKSILINHSAMAFLIGLQKVYETSVENENIIIIKLSNRESLEFNLQIDKDAHYSVEFQMGADVF